MDVRFQPTTDHAETATPDRPETATAGAVAVEYGLLGALVALAILGALVALGDSIRDLPLQAIIDAIMGR